MDGVARNNKKGHGTDSRKYGQEKRRNYKDKFSEEEQQYCEKRVNKYECYAARFAAKEAVMKAFGNGFTKRLSFKEITVENNKYGSPKIIMSGNAADIFNEIGAKRCGEIIRRGFVIIQIYASCGVTVVANRMEEYSNPPAPASPVECKGQDNFILVHHITSRSVYLQIVIEEFVIIACVPYVSH
jgi:holo-[acyl-carrier-protein] synthase